MAIVPSTFREDKAILKVKKNKINLKNTLNIFFLLLELSGNVTRLAFLEKCFASLFRRSELFGLLIENTQVKIPPVLIQKSDALKAALRLRFVSFRK